MDIRTACLEKFTKELIINSLPKNYIEKFEDEEIKQKIQVLKKRWIEENRLPEKIKEDKSSDVNSIEEILNDETIQSIECTGENKNLVIKKQGKEIEIMRKLNSDEINEIINFFSEKAKIPRIEGIFKAIVNNMVITAIESGKNIRFIITKINPVNSDYL